MKQREETTHQSSLNYHQALDREYKWSNHLLFVRDTTQCLIFPEYRLSVQLAKHKGGYKKTTQGATCMWLKQARFLLENEKRSSAEKVCLC